MLFLQTMKRQKVLSFLLLLFTLAVGIVIGTLVNTGVRADRQSSTSGAPDATPLVIPQAVPIANDFTKLTKRVEPSVVYIQSDYLAKPGKGARRRNDNDGAEDDDNSGSEAPRNGDPSDMFRRFFGQKEPRSFRTEGSGTGFVVDKNGYIITNYHVVSKADRIKVKLAGEEIDYRARVIGFDSETDLAVLKIDVKQPLIPVQIGNSDSVQVGDWVIAIGSPFGLQATVTAGIVSAERTPRDLPGAGSFQNFLQTDAAINPGNSGGPLLNVRGEVIGVNTMIATHSGSYEGIGFALPSNMAAKVYNDIIRSGRVVRGSIGIKWSRGPNDSDTLRAFGLDHGVLVESVAAHGPAGKAGLKADDIVVAMDNKPVRDGEELVTKVADLPIGSPALFTVDRDGKKLDFKVTIEERSKVWEDEPKIAENRPVAPELPKQHIAPARFGITIMRLTPKERKDLEIEAKDGVKVTSVDPGSFADDIGMVEGDAILSINRQPVTSPDDVMKLQSSLKPGQPVAIHVARGANGGHRGSPQRYYLSGRLPEP
ncbi:MAG: trypsin-like peptidase domain-containing protein [Acidobacteriaceae bacterium]|nr:trypsin-like peptidase domain-containing protein [Acidobacteriaceae bacterium]MBV9037317.1 trypsin-like peptidase domain-containing protein [Acidobacteriaceae bacterium]MBV9307938.1 trypsin-like peptidase domain-containing protein [Acidobacteriaceae bacterium]MBV9675446.1 trypsin-like peptidase domain-containing protein [Acidobacteriaceae bacterium]MBV9938858.1 trypsin-like peptidase domain-containing protein [Acidobacteriaceae bacterium]